MLNIVSGGIFGKASHGFWLREQLRTAMSAMRDRTAIRILVFKVRLVPFASLVKSTVRERRTLDAGKWVLGMSLKSLRSLSYYVWKGCYRSRLGCEPNSFLQSPQWRVSVKVIRRTSTEFCNCGDRFNAVDLAMNPN